MRRDIDLEATLVAKHAALSSLLNERARPCGRRPNRSRSGTAAMLRAASDARVRAGRRSRRCNRLRAALEALVDPVTRGDPTSPLRWTCKSKAKGAAALTAQGWRVSATTVGHLLHDLGYRLQALQTTLEETAHPDRNAQFVHINATATAFLLRNQPVSSVDTKKKELIGDFKMNGREWQPTGCSCLT